MEKQGTPFVTGNIQLWENDIHQLQYIHALIVEYWNFQEILPLWDIR